MHVEWYELLAICVTCVLCGALLVHLLHVRPLIRSLIYSTKCMNDARDVLRILREHIKRTD